MANSLATCALWRAACATATAVSDALSVAEPRPTKSGGAHERRRGLRVRVEPLEDRLLYSGAPFVSGANFAEAGVAYSLNLSANGNAVDHWTINWGDGASGQSDTQTFSGAATTASHVYLQGGSDTITATAVNKKGKALSTTSLGVVPAAQSDGVMEIAQAELSQLNAQNVTVESVSAQPDGKLLVLTSAGLDRFNADGSPDTTFGTGGVAPLPSIAGAAGRALIFNTVDVNGDGQIAIGGAGKKAWDVAQYSAAGRLARTRSAITPTAAQHPAQAVSLSFEGHQVILLGQDKSGNNVYWMNNLTGAGGSASATGQDAAWSYDQGAIDDAAGGDGSSWLVGSDGTNFYVAHYSSTGTEYSATEVANDTGGGFGAVAVSVSGDLLVGRQFLTRYLPGGAVDQTFGNNGQVLLPAALQGGVSRILSLSSGQILVVGENFQTIARYNSDGSLDTTFGAGGVLATGLSTGSSGSLMQLTGGNVLAADTDGRNIYFETISSLPSAVTIAPAPTPTVSISGPSTVNVGDSYSLNLAAVYPANDPAPGAISSWLVNWGDGTANAPDLQTVSGTTTSVQHAFTSAAANDLVTATATNQFGSYVTNPVNIAVVSPVPDVSISGAPAADVGLTYQLNLSALYPSNDPTGALNSWVINWGDGTTDSPDLQTVSGTATSVPHTFTAAATGQITAMATDQYGSYLSNTVNLAVNAGAPTIASFQVNGGSPQRITVSSLTVAFSQPVTLSSDALTLIETDNVHGSPSPLAFNLASPDGGTTYVLTFSVTADTGGSLPNGTFNLTINPSAVTDLAGAALSAGATFSFYRLDTDSGGGLQDISENSGLSFNPLATLNPVLYVTAGSPLTIGATAAPYGNNGDLLGFQWTVLNPQGNAFALPGGGATSSPSITFTPNVAGTWSVALTVTDKALSLSTTLTTQTFAVAPGLPAYSYTAPASNPSAPSGWDAFAPTMGGSAAAGTPIIDASNLTAAADNSILVTGAQLTADTGSSAFTDTQFLVYGQTSASNGTLSNGAIQAATANGVTMTISSTELANSMFLVWPVNANGVGSPIAVNATHATWVGPGTASDGQTVSVYGQNLSNGAATPQSWVFLQPTGGGAGQWATVTSVNPYQVQFTIPSNLANGTYQVWVNNGLGAQYGWSQAPPTLTIAATTSWPSQYEVNVKNYGAIGNGVADDGPAILSAINAIKSMQTSNPNADATLYFPAGTYLVSSVQIILPDNVRVLGDSEASSTLLFNGNLAQLSTNNGGDGTFAIGQRNGWSGHVGSYNVEFDSLSMSYTGTSAGTLLSQNYGLNFTLNGVAVSADSGVSPLSWQGSDQLKLENCTIVGQEVPLYANVDVQVNNDAFYMAYGTEAALAIWGGSNISITNCTAQDYNEKIPTGWGVGRILVENLNWGSIFNVYFGGNSTINLGDPSLNNSGEQVLCEGPQDWAYGNITSATANIVVIPVSEVIGGTPGPGESIIITSGTGVGQIAQIQSVTQNGSSLTLTLTGNWTVLPDATSHIDVCSIDYNCVYYDNTFSDQTGPDGSAHLRASSGIELWVGGYNVVIANNTMNNMVGGVVLSDDGFRSPNDFVQVSNNQINNCEQNAILFETWEPTGDTDALDLGVAVRGNVINGAGGGEFGGSGISLTQTQTGDQSIVEDNTFENTAIGISVSNDADVLFYKNTFMSGTFATGSVGIAFNGSNAGLILEDDIFQNYAQSYTGTLPASLLTAGLTGGALQSIPDIAD
jgi:uncharacterized delta-60 repeat protein